MNKIKFFVLLNICSYVKFLNLLLLVFILNKLLRNVFILGNNVFKR